MTIDTYPPNSPATAGPISATRVHLPGSPAFDAGTRLWNGAVTRRPAAVVRPTSCSEVQSARATRPTPAFPSPSEVVATTGLDGPWPPVDW
jgi:hypothetical protein